MATSAPKKQFSFLDLDKALSKIDTFEMGSLLDTNEFLKTTEWIPVGNYLLAGQISGSIFGGIPNNRSLGLTGDPGTGKTFLCLNIVKQAQKLGYDVIYCDSEGALDDEQVKTKFKIDPLKMRYQPIKTVFQFKSFVSNLLQLVAKAKAETGVPPKILLIVDSLGMLTTDKEVNNAMEGKNASDMGLKAKELRSLFRTITLDLTGAKIPLVATNHTTTGGIGGYMPTKESAGGDGPIFSMSNLLFLSKKALKDGTTKTGIIVTSRPKKLRYTKPTDIDFHISFETGMNPYVGLEKYVSWDACGIQRGRLEVNKKTGELTFEPSETALRWCVKHLNKTVSSKQLFTSEVFTEDVLRQLDEKVIKPTFLLPAMKEDDEFGELLDSPQGEPEEIEGDE